MGDGIKKILMFSDIEGCQASPGEQSSFLCSDTFYNKIADMLDPEKDGDPNLHIAFLGDYFDQGMLVYASIMGMTRLLDNPKFAGRVYVILGNRDVNKLRFCFELRHRLAIKNSIQNMTSKDINTLKVEETQTTKDGKSDTVKKCPVFDKGWKSWSPHFFGIYKDEIIDPPNYTVKGKIENDSDVGLVKHILMSSMGANKTEGGKMTGLYSFMPYDKIATATEEAALTYLKAALGILQGEARPDDALDLLGFFRKCKLAYVFNGTFGNVLLAHGGGFDPDAFLNKAYVDSFGEGMPDVIEPADYHSTLEKFRQRLSGIESVKTGGALTPQDRLERRNEFGHMANEKNMGRFRRASKTVTSSVDDAIVKQSVDEAIVEPSVDEAIVKPSVDEAIVEPSVDAYNNLLQDVLDEISRDNPVFTWKFVLLQALGLKPDDEDARYKSLIQSCSQDGCSGPNNRLSNDKDTNSKLAKILKDSGITHVSYGHKPICFPIPVIYLREEIPGVTFISNDTSNGNRTVEEIGENTAIGTMVIFERKDDGGVKSKIEPIELNGREKKVGNYEEMYKPLTLETTPVYEQQLDGANFLKYGTKKVVFNNLLKKEPPKIAYGQLKFEDVQPAQESAASLPVSGGGKRRSRHRKQQRSKRGSTRGGSKKTRRNQRKHTKRGRKARK